MNGGLKKRPRKDLYTVISSLEVWLQFFSRNLGAASKRKRHLIKDSKEELLRKICGQYLRLASIKVMASNEEITVNKPNALEVQSVID